MLKWIAIITMLVDHIAYYFYDQIPYTLYEIMRGIGRMAMPIFAFSLAFGFMHSKNWLKYFIRLLFTGVISELIIRQVYEVQGYYRSGINILFTFSFALVFLIALKIVIHSGYDMLVKMQPIQSDGQGSHLPYQFRFNLEGVEIPPLIGLISGTIFMFLSAGCILYFDTEYSLYGLLMVVAFYVALLLPPEKQLTWAYILIFSVNFIFQITEWLGINKEFYFHSLQWLTVLAVPLCFGRAEEPKPKRWQQYFFYAFYPLHIALIGLIRYLFF